MQEIHLIQDPRTNLWYAGKGKWVDCPSKAKPYRNVGQAKLTAASWMLQESGEARKDFNIYSMEVDITKARVWQYGKSSR